MANFEIRKSSDKQYFWRFVANNGQVICNSETYTTKQSAKESIQIIKNLAPLATEHDLTGEK